MISKVTPPSSLLSSIAVGLVGCALGATALAANPKIRIVGTVASMATSDAELKKADPIDYVNAAPLPLPIATNFSEEEAQAELIGAMASPVAQANARPVFSRGFAGDGKTSELFLGKPARIVAEDEYAPQEAGTTNHPFSTARADGYTGATNKIYPFRAAGKLFFQEGSSNFICSAALIKKGIVLTAAHCVNDFGKNTFYKNFSFVPGYRSGSAPYGKWQAKSIFVLNSYANGTDQCSQKGVVCKNDVAIIVLQPQGSTLPGTATGWYGFAYNGAGFTSNNRTHLTQIGYPACLDNGAIMERNDSEGFKSSANANNTLIGSLMCGGSSGGPWILNFGRRPALTDTTSGTSAAENTVIGVTSWGSTSSGPKQQGASPFLNTNVQALVTQACNSSPANCN